MQQVWIQKNTYRDSVSLMFLADKIKKLKGVIDVAVLMGTPANKTRLAKAGYGGEDVDSARSGDLCIGVQAENPDALKTAGEMILEILAGKKHLTRTGAGRLAVMPKTLASAIKYLPNAQLVSISIPGEYASREAQRALELGLHVFLFSDNVPLEEEIRLKKLAQEKGLVLMGPDCGTALINGTPLGFCNRVPKGPVSLVSASGTGAQEVISRLASHHTGVTHVIGTGGRDLLAEVGGVTFRMALDNLADDPQTQVIVLVSKPPALEVEARLLERASEIGKAVVVCFIGHHSASTHYPNLYFAETLDHAADIAHALVNGFEPPGSPDFDKFIALNHAILESYREGLAPSQRYVRGLYSGGTLADEAALLLSQRLPGIQAGNGFGSVLPISNWEKSQGHVIIDLGEDRFTQGRPHPMIDAGKRIERLAIECQDPSVAVLLMDIVLGTNADENPADKLVPAIMEARRSAEHHGRLLPVIIHVCGTEDDPQNLPLLEGQFRKAGCAVFRSNVEAAFAAAWVTGID